MMRRFGLIGFPLTHSFSQRYFTEKFEREGLAAMHRYEVFPLERIDRFPRLLEQYPDLRGLNVTIPYKEAVLPYLDALSAEAADIGAVNTILLENGLCTGYNTDVIGFAGELRRLLEAQDLKTPRALVLGTGGAAKAVCWVLRRESISYQVVSRRAGVADLTYTELTRDLLAAHRLIINTTPLGMYPALDTAPELPYDALTSRHILYDLVYNPPETLFLRRGRECGATTLNGLTMLYGQAEAAWQIWNKLA